MIPSGTGFMALCPAHEDHRPSLRISEGDDGRVLLHCFTGCANEDIVHGIGLQPRDLFSETSCDRRETPSKPKRVAITKPKGEAYPTAVTAIEALERRYGPYGQQWLYHTAADVLVGVVLRWDTPQGKEIRPVSLHGGEWFIAAMAEPRPVYMLPEIRVSDVVFLTEGEKACDALRLIEVVATTSSGGSNAAHKTDWTPLAGKTVHILPDHDDPGEKYAATVADILANLSPPATIKIVHLPDLPQKGDAYDWIEARDSKDEKQLRDTLKGLCDSTPEFSTVSAHTTFKNSGNNAVLCYQTQPQGLPAIPWRPFPLDQIPSPLHEYIVAKAESIDVDVTQIVLPMLSALGAAIGNTRRLHVRDDWNVPPILWTAVVCESGSAKTPAMNAALRFTAERQTKSWELYEEEMSKYKTREAIYESEFNVWRRTKQNSDDPPEAPAKPILAQFRVSDCTVEALATDLLENPRGLLLARDELSGWFGSHDRYASRGGADQSAYLEMYNAGLFSVNRKTSGRLFVPRAAVCVTGTIQPAILRRLMGTEQRENGMQARFLFAFPERRIRDFSETAVSLQLTDNVAMVFDRLWQLDFQRESDGQSCPLNLELTAEALEVFKVNTLRLRREAHGLSPDLHAAYSKLEEIPVRLGLIIHEVRVASGDPAVNDSFRVDATSIQAGIEITKWFEHETRRVYEMLRGTPAARDNVARIDTARQYLIDWIRRLHGPVTVRQVMSLRTRYPTAEDAEAALEDLAAADLGYWQFVPSTSAGGQPTRKFHLREDNVSASAHTTPIIAGEIEVV